MQNPDNLRVSAAAEDLAVLVYRFIAGFPIEERYALSAQMRKAAISIGSNIFEGCGRQTKKAFIACLYVSHGEACELVFQLRVAIRLQFGDAKLSIELRKRIDHVRQMLANLIRKLESEQE
jgi:four helix bundle protein